MPTVNSNKKTKEKQVYFNLFFIFITFLSKNEKTYDIERSDFCGWVYLFVYLLISEKIFHSISVFGFYDIKK